MSADVTGSENAACLGLDWGTSSLRACLLDAGGAIIGQRASDAGITNVGGGEFDAALQRVAGDWLKRQPDLKIIASGMIGSRQGWVEAPYAECPAGAEDVANALIHLRAGSGHEIAFVPGVKITAADGMPDVIRGEETQIFGALNSSPGAAAARAPNSSTSPPRTQGLFVLPGTHSKWAWVSASKIVSFATFMTGEVFDVLRRHSILGRQMNDPAHSADILENNEPWCRGVEYGLSRASGSGGVLKRLFSTRTLGLFGELEPAGAHDYLSGLLIGSEVREALACMAGDEAPGAAPEEVVVVGDSALSDRYERALHAASVKAVRGPADAASRGHWSIARAAGLIAHS
ncbi:MAG: 2-dehydro-3-deoxygalactonokinase [Gammaproteobacteria bacterium]